MFDDFPIHIGDVECAIGRVGHLHRAKPIVTTRQELDLLFVARPARNQSNAVGEKFFAVDQVAAAIGHESVLAKILREGVDRTLRLLGCFSIKSLDSSHVAVPNSWL